MAALKNETVTVRIEPPVKAVAEQERLSLSNLIEVMIRQHCSAAGVEIGGSDARAQARPANRDPAQGMRNEHDQQSDGKPP